MDQSIRNKLRTVVTQCRKLLEEAVTQVLQGQFGISASPKEDEVQVEAEAGLKLSPEDQGYRRDLVAHLGHIQALGYKAKDALGQLVREIAFTHLNRLCAYKMMEARAVWVGGKPFREAVSRGMKSQGFQFFLADHAADKKLFETGHQDVAYRHFLGWLGALLSEEIGVLFSPTDPANRLFPPQRVLDDVLALLNSDDLNDIWAEDETIGWVYQYFTPKELRDQVRKESAAPRNSYELAFRNQFFTPRYVVEFLTDNTLGRIWYEMRKGDTKLKDQCRYMVRRPSEVFLADPVAAGRRVGVSVDSADTIPPTVQAAFRGQFASAVSEKDGILQSWIGLAVPQDQYAAATGHPYREGHDHPTVNAVWKSVHEPSEGGVPLHPLKVLVALSQLVLTSSGGPYAARASEQLWAALTAAAKVQVEQGDLSQDELLRQPVCVPHRPKKDPRDLRILDPACGSGHFLLYCFDLLLTIYEEAYADPDLGPKLKNDYPTLEALRRDVPRLILAHNLHGIDIDLRASQIAALALWLRCQRAYREMGLKQDRPKITKSNIVCAEPMPGENEMLKEFVADLQPKVLGHLVEVVFDKMKLAGEAGSLLKIEEELRDAVADVKQQWVAEHEQATDRKGRPLLFTRAEMERLANRTPQPQLFDLSEITDEQFWNQAESQVLTALRAYAAHAANGSKLQRQLFADDASQGFAFIDLCQKRFDVVLMNPPFGDPSKGCNGVLETVMATSGRDLGCAFVSEAACRLCTGGLIAALLTATPLFQPTFSDWRQRLLLGRERTTSVLAHLGGNVLDEATVIVCAFVSSEASKSLTPFLRLERCDDKEGGLLHRIRRVGAGVADTGIFLAVPDDFRKLKGSPVSYWMSARFRHRLASLPPLEGEGGTSKQGTATADEFRFARAWWEVGTDKRWISYSKSSEYSPFWDDPTWLMNFGNDGRELRETGRAVIRGASYFGRPGVTYPSKSVLGFNPRVHPAGASFGHSGSVVFPRAISPTCMLGYLASRPTEYALSLLTGSLQGNRILIRLATEEYVEEVSLVPASD
jgi:hypothetical protein